MGHDITTAGDQADGLRDLAWKALSLHPSTTTTLAERLGAEAPACIAAVIARAEHDMRPVPRDHDGRSAWNAAIDERLRRLAVKVLPTANDAATVEWRSAMVEALADLPAMVALTAAKRAIHRPFRFIGDIEAALREIADEIMDERRRRLATFERHRAAIDRALNPPPALPEPPAPPPPSADDVARLNAWMSSKGLRTRFTEDGDTYQAAATDHEEAIEAAAA